MDAAGQAAAACTHGLEQQAEQAEKDAEQPAEKDELPPPLKVAKLVQRNAELERMLEEERRAKLNAVKDDNTRLAELYAEVCGERKRRGRPNKT